ncbi:MAG: DUF5522 domain-containing protein [Actinomycetota bacterium]
MSDQLAGRPLTQPDPGRLPPTHPAYDEILVRHSAAMAAGASGYADPVTGFFVMTAAFHAERGHCCANGCRHCPYVA